MKRPYFLAYKLIGFITIFLIALDSSFYLLFYFLIAFVLYILFCFWVVLINYISQLIAFSVW